jgi:hypothetical protein
VIPVLSAAAVASLLLRRAAGRSEPPAGPVVLARRGARPPLSPAPVAPRPSAPAWVPPLAGECPEGFPVKAKGDSGIFHEPGGRHYARTRPDRCYASADDARADGLRAARA